MSIKKASLKSISVFLVMAVLISLQIIHPALAVATYEVGVPFDVTEFSLDLSVSESSPFAGIEFGLTLSSETALKFSSFAQGDDVKGSSGSPFVTVKGVHYFGFYRGTNAFTGDVNVGSLNFTYTGEAAQSIVLTHVQVARIANRRAIGAKKSPQLVTINLKRVEGEEVTVTGGGDSEGVSFAITLNGDKLPLGGLKLRSSYFDDVDENWFWAVNEIDYLYELGVVKGTGDRLYSPGANIQRCDFMLMLVRAYELEADFTENFDDVEEGEYYYEALGIAKALGIALGVGENNYAPHASITREDMMSLVDRTLEAIGEPLPVGTHAVLEDYLDWNLIDFWAVDSVATLVQSGIIQGNGQGMINPLGFTTRAEMAVVVYRLLTMGIDVNGTGDLDIEP